MSPNLVGTKNLNGFLNQVSSTKVIDTVFSFFLTKNEKPGSILTFGGYNVEKFAKEGLKESDVKWFDIDKQNMQYWSIPMGGDQISLGSGPNSTAKISSSNVILDSGLSYALIPSHDIKVMMQLLNDEESMCLNFYEDCYSHDVIINAHSHSHATLGFFG